MSLDDVLLDRLGSQPAPREIVAAIKELAAAPGGGAGGSSASRQRRWNVRQRCDVLLPLAVGSNDRSALFYLARWLQRTPALVGRALGLLRELAPAHPEAARLLVSNLMLGEPGVRDAVIQALERWPAEGAYAHVVNDHGPNEAVAVQLRSGDPEQIVAGLRLAADSCSSLPAFGVEIFEPFADGTIPDQAQVCFVELLCKYHRFDPPPGEDQRCAALVDFALDHAGDAALLDVAAWFRTSDESWVATALRHVGRRALQGAQLGRARKLIAGLIAASSRIGPRVLALIDEWPAEDSALRQVVEPLSADLALQASRAGDLARLRRLLVHRPRVDETFDDKGFNALHNAVLGGDAAVVQVLLDAGAATEVPVASQSPHRGRTALQLAALAGNDGIVEQLLRAGANVAVTTTERPDQSLLQLAAVGGAAAALDLLVAAGHDPNAADLTGQRPLHVAAAGGHLATVGRLLALGAEVDATNDLGKTALHYAAEQGRLQGAQGLVEAGASLLARDRDGELPGDAARTVEVQRYLGRAAEARGGDPVRTWLRDALAFFRELGFFADDAQLSDDALIDRLQLEHGPLNSSVQDADLGLLVLDGSRVWVADYYGPDIGPAVTPAARRYRESLCALSRIGRRRVSFGRVSERWAGPRGPIEVSYAVRGRQHVVQPEYLGEHFDVGFINLVNRTLVPTGHHLALYRATYMDLWGACIMVLTEAEQRRIETERDGRFFTAEELEADRAVLHQLAAEDEDL